jgi:hypothetical protein
LKKEIYHLPVSKEAHSERIFTPKKRFSVRAKVLEYFSYQIANDGRGGTKAFFKFHYKDTALGNKILASIVEARISQSFPITEPLLNQIIERVKEKGETENIKKRLKIIRFRNV